MGNSLGGKKTTKVMKMNGETMKLKTPVAAGEVVKEYPAGYVLLESESVKHYGLRAKPLKPEENLSPKRLYFLVELPNNQTEEKFTRRVKSGIQMSAKDRLESLMLARRSVSDLTIMNKPANREDGDGEGSGSGGDYGEVKRVKLKVPKAEVEKIMKGSESEGDVAERIMELCMGRRAGDNNYGNGNGAVGDTASFKEKHTQEMLWKNNNNNNNNGRIKEGLKAREKRVSFMPISEGGSQIAVAF